MHVRTSGSVRCVVATSSLDLGVDFLDTSEMSHPRDLGARLEAEPETLAVAELLLTKLQLAEIDGKDMSDVAMLLWDHGPAGSDGELNLSQLAATCAADWGLYTTVTQNLGTRAKLLSGLVTGAPDRERITDRIASGRVFIPAEAPWLREFRTEICAFPASKFTDQVDSMVNFIEQLANIRWKVEIHGRDHALCAVNSPKPGLSPTFGEARVTLLGERRLVRYS